MEQLEEGVTGWLSLKCPNTKSIPLSTVYQTIKSKDGSMWRAFHEPSASLVSSVPSSSSSLSSSWGSKQHILSLYALLKDGVISDIVMDINSCFLQVPASSPLGYLSNIKGVGMISQEISLSNVVLQYKDGHSFGLNEDHISCNDIQEEIDIEWNTDEGLSSYQTQFDEMVFLEGEAVLSAGGVLSMILTPVMNSVMSPIINVVS
jgi:hypothetical protein